MRFVVVTGLSGAGKSQTVKYLEDMGFFCIDNLPPVLMPKLAEIVSANMKYEKVAFVIDMRVGEMINELSDDLARLKEKGYEYKLLFMQASDEVLVKRYKETRRSHPMNSENGLLSSIKKERKLLSGLLDAADVVIDTSDLAVGELGARLRDIFSEDTKNEMAINLLAFGFKYGIPADADLVFDVRCFPNPFYDDELRYKTGNDKAVQDFVMSGGDARVFLDKLCDMLLMLFPLYIGEGKASTTVAIGCTGGKHRSVTFVNKVYDALTKAGYSVNRIYRDIEKGRKG
ncbi:MAG: RNase adapter RapZ [Clostridia bacterium]|nr:RNase adapter RapZ [Clostridia bacterium]